MARLGFTSGVVDLSLARDEARESDARCDRAFLLPAVERRTEAAPVPFRPVTADRLLDADSAVRLERLFFEVVVRPAVFPALDGRRLAEAVEHFDGLAIATRAPFAGGEVKRWIWFVRRTSSID